jgi:hypothetical protein
MSKRKPKKEREIKPSEVQRSDTVSRLRLTDGWKHVALLVEPSEPLRKTVANLVIPNQTCRIRLMADGLNAITELCADLKKGRSVDAVIIDSKPISDRKGISVEYFLDSLEREMIRANTSVKTITVIPLYNFEWETKCISNDIHAFMESRRKEGRPPRLVVSKPIYKFGTYGMYSRYDENQFTNILKKTLNNVEGARIALEAQIEAAQRKEQKG